MTKLSSFAKNQQDNVSNKELQMPKLLAAKLLAFDDAALNQAINALELLEVINET